MKKLFSFLALFVLFSLSVLAAPPESVLTFRGGKFSYFASHDLHQFNDKIERLIVVVHGSERNADTYYNSLANMAVRVGQEDSTLVISTHFKIAQDELLPQEFIWTYESWWEADPALNGQRVSSFEVIDHLISLVANPTLFPSLKKVILTGHSAGGQLTQRYAAGSLLQDEMHHLEFRYVVLNPGAYMYLSNKRPDGNGGFVVPRTSCDYNRYKYGLDGLNAYMARSSLRQILSQYIARDVIYLVGGADTIEQGIDQTCQARLQGRMRLERAINFKAHLDDEFAGHDHKFDIVPNIGHTQWGMYNSTIGTSAIFPDVSL